MASDESPGDPRPTSPAPEPARERLLRALALDPGGTTGYAICDIHNMYREGEWITLEEAERRKPKVSIGWEQAKLSESELTELLETVVPDVIICEDFEYRNRARAGLDLTPPRLIGVVKLYAQSTGIKLILQKAAVGKGHYSDHRLKTLELYRRGTPHGRDALRHLLHWLTFKGGNEHIDFFQVEIEVLSVDAIL